MPDKPTCIIPDCQRPATNRFTIDIRRIAAGRDERFEVAYHLCARCSRSAAARRTARATAERSATWRATA